jgi:hypothetical protein
MVYLLDKRRFDLGWALPIFGRSTDAIVHISYPASSSFVTHSPNLDSYIVHR